MTDREYLLNLLASDGAWHSLTDIIRRSQEDRGHGLTVHSRVSDLRKQGYRIDQRDETLNGRRHSSYRIVSLAGTVAPKGDGDSPSPVVAAVPESEQPSLFQIPARARGAYDEVAA